MKRTSQSLIIAVAFCSILFFSACFTTASKFDYEQLKAEVVKIELIYYENLDAALIGTSLFNFQCNAIDSRAERMEQMKDFDFDKSTTLGILNAELQEEFLYEVSTIGFYETHRHYDSPKEYGIKLHFANGGFKFISFSGFAGLNNLVAKYDSNSDLQLLRQPLPDDYYYHFIVEYDSNGKFLEYYGNMYLAAESIAYLLNFFEYEIL